MNKLTLKEGLLRMLDGEKITVMVPADLSTMWMEDFMNLRGSGAFCVLSSDLERGAPAQAVPEKKPEVYPDNDGGAYTMVKGKVERVDEQPAQPSRKRVDMGKIKALADAGWNAQRIAEEMGLSAPTVRKYLKEGLGE